VEDVKSSPASPTGSRAVECHLAGREGAGADAGGGAVPPKYGWAHLHAQHRFWNQTPGEGLDSPFPELDQRGRDLMPLLGLHPMLLSPHRFHFKKATTLVIGK